MSSPILSQDEIDALLHRDRSPSSSDELQEFCSWLPKAWQLGSTTSRLNPSKARASHLERLARIWTAFSDDALAAAADLGDNEMLMLMSASDAELLLRESDVPPMMRCS